ncbi:MULTISPECIES: phosphatase PAP2 family protein [Streptomyces]|uniref:phosphatase PAP2 family protein n=1 Tax=Streptomyces TaxID=1883 RepID=UPI001318CD70|nr:MULTISPECIES: phosphatase PAP2 family protein [Streptomyces]QGZ47681.1 phosphatase PAP2 family protein [Streptomyces sp. QHH-9511]GGT93611.1 phosphatase PAP2 family protein [Streptomyces lateritius]
MRSSAVVSGALAVLLLVLVVVDCQPLLSLDRSVAESLHRSAVAEPGLTRLSQVLSDWVWDPWTMRALITVAVVMLWWRRERWLALWLVGASLAAAAVQQGMKAAVDRDRPAWADPVDSAHYAAFPSGHALTAALTCALLLWVLALHWRETWRGWSVLAVTAVVSVLGVGWTRVYLGVHWPSDVVAGWLLGWCGAAVAIITYRKYGRNPDRRDARPPAGGG